MKSQIKILLTIVFISIGIMTSYGQTPRDFARMAKAKMSMGDYKGAIEDFSSIIRLQPDYEMLYQAYYGRGYAKFQQGKYKAAKNDFDEAIKIFPNDAQVYFWRAYTKYRLKYRASSEIADYNRAILLKPDYAEAYFNRGQAKIKNNQEKGGCKDLKEAFDLGYKEAETHIKIHCGEP